MRNRKDYLEVSEEDDMKMMLQPQKDLLVRSIRVRFHQHVYSQLFMHTDTKSSKKTVKLSVFFAFLGSAQAKAACITLMKLIIVVNFTNMFTHRIYNQRSTKTIKDSQVNIVLFALLGSSHVKASCRMLVKFTPGVNFINVFTYEFFVKT